MQGLYLYCIRQKGRSGFSRKGIDRGKILVLPYRDLEAVVSQVSLKKFDSVEIQRKAQEDLKWIKGKAQIHEHVIEQAMGIGTNKLIPVIPMQFGVAFKSIGRLKQNLANCYEQFKKSLKKLEGKQEWGVKVFLKEKIFRKFIENRSEVIVAKKKKIESIPKGIAFFAQKRLDKIIDQKKDKALDKITENIETILNQLVFSKNKAKLLQKDFTGRQEEMILNSFYLIEKSQLVRFQEEVKILKEKYSAQGLIIEMTGPWPPYHFT